MLVGAFYAIAGVMAMRAVLSTRLIDVATAAIGGKRPAHRETLQHIWLLISSLIIFVGGIALLLRMELAAALFAISAALQILYLLIAAPNYFDVLDPPGSEGPCRYDQCLRPLRRRDTVCALGLRARAAVPARTPASASRRPCRSGRSRDRCLCRAEVCMGRGARRECRPGRISNTKPRRRMKAGRCNSFSACRYKPGLAAAADLAIFRCVPVCLPLAEKFFVAHHRLPRMGFLPVGDIGIVVWDADHQPCGSRECPCELDERRCEKVWHGLTPQQRSGFPAPRRRDLIAPLGSPSRQSRPWPRRARSAWPPSSH